MFHRHYPRPGGSRHERPKLVVRVQLPAGVLRAARVVERTCAAFNANTLGKENAMAHKGLFLRAGKAPPADSMNEAKGRAYAFSPEHALAQYAATGTFYGTFYANESPLFFLASLRSSEDAGPHKPACEGSTPSAATNVPESSNGRTRGFDPRDEGPNPSSGASTWVWLKGGALGLEPRECEFDSRHPYPCGARHLVMAPVLQTG
jgi:hypothetical protein